ncbi:MAG: hypothetical protein AAGA85_13380 [Bacteroidota bacterium]
MNRPVCFFLLIIQGLAAASQSDASKPSEKELTLQGATMKGFEVAMDLPASFAEKELWRQAKKVATVLQSDDYLSMKFDLEGGQTLVVYGLVTDVQDDLSHLSLVSESVGIDTHMRQMLMDLQLLISTNYLQRAIERNEGQAAAISQRLSRTTEPSIANDLWKELSGLNEVLVALRTKQQKLLSRK